MQTLDEKFPHITYREGENLNIKYHTNRIIKKLWLDKRHYPTVAFISMITGISERQLLRRVAEMQLPHRKDIQRKSNKRLKLVHNNKYIRTCVRLP